LRRDKDKRKYKALTVMSGHVVALLDAVSSGGHERRNVTSVFSEYKITYLNKVAGYLSSNLISAYKATRCNNPQHKNLVKGKGHPITGHEGPRGGEEV
jgi:hypothetical protein